VDHYAYLPDGVYSHAGGGVAVEYLINNLYLGVVITSTKCTY
jgi:hypothetical protein